MKLIYLSVLTLALLACSSEKNEQNPVETGEITTNLSDTVQVNIDESEQQSLADYIIEDYSKLKTRSEIENVFGKENMEDGISWYAEGTVEKKHIFVSNPDNGHIVKYLLDDDNNSVDWSEYSYRVYDEDFVVIQTQKIESNQGIYTGMMLKDLFEWNEKEEIRFSGFDWDYHGTVHSGEQNQNPQSKLALTGYSLEMDRKESDIEDDFSGDMTLSTNTKKVLNANILVGNISVFNEGYQEEYEDSEAIYWMSMEFDEFFEFFQGVVKNKDIDGLKKISIIGNQSDLKIDDLTNDFDGVFTKEATQKILSLNSSEIEDSKLPNEENGKKLTVYLEQNEGGDIFESSTFFYFQKTDTGWKLVSVKIAG